MARSTVPAAELTQVTGDEHPGRSKGAGLVPEVDAVAAQRLVLCAAVGAWRRRRLGDESERRRSFARRGGSSGEARVAERLRRIGLDALLLRQRVHGAGQFGAVKQVVPNRR